MPISQNINCPHCRKGFGLSDALSQDLEAHLHDKLNAEIKKQDEAFKKKLALLETQQREALFKAEEEKIQLRTKLENEIAQKVKSKFELEQRDLQNQLEEQIKKTQMAQAKELELLKMQRSLESQQKELELTMARKLQEERQNIANELKMQLDQDSTLKLAEKDKELTDLKKIIDELKRKSHVTSQQLQGEVLELQIESLLSELFPEDNIVEVKKGARGADVSQEVLFQSGRKAGAILYECKQTTEWGAQWVAKLKEDMRARNADVGVIVSSVLPKGVKFMDCYNGVWVCTPSMVKPLVQLLRDGLIRAARAEIVAATPQDQRDYLFKYMTSPKFIQKIQAMCEATQSMRETLDSEKRSIQKNWKKREQEIEGFESQMISLYGELQGVVGKALPRVKLLEGQE